MLNMHNIAVHHVETTSCLLPVFYLGCYDYDLKMAWGCVQGWTVIKRVKFQKDQSRVSQVTTASCEMASHRSLPRPHGAALA